MCGYFKIRRVESPEWMCPKGLDKRECAICDGYEAYMESAWALFEDLVKKKRLDE